MMAMGSSPRGLSEVTTAASAMLSATPPMMGRLVRSRSPPQPNTQIRRPRVKSRAVVKMFSRALGEWA